MPGAFKSLHVILLLKQNCKDNDRAFDRIYKECAYAHQIQEVVDDRQDENTKQYTDHLTPAALHGYAADNGHCNGIHLIRLSGGRCIDRHHSGRLDDCSQTNRNTHDNKSEDLNFINAQTR